MKHVEPNGDIWFGVHEAFYADSGKVDGWTEEVVKPFGETPEDLAADLAGMAEALKLPVLDYETSRR